MREKKSRGEINLSRLLGRCQDIANTSSDLGQEWRLPKFLSSCEDLLSALPKAPDPSGETLCLVTGRNVAICDTVKARIRNTNMHDKN